MIRIVDLTGEALAAALKAKRATTVSVCIPCRNEAATIGAIVAQIRTSLCVGDGDGLTPWVDEVLVFDDGSTDATAQVAREAGADVVPVGSVLAELGEGSGKGNVLWSSVAASHGDVVVWCDGDLLSFTPAYIRRLLAPLFLDPEVQFVKGFYDRVLDASGEGGGRNTELVARPMLRLLHPALADVRQPLGGEYAVRRTLLERMRFPQGYGVEIALLIDALALCGAAAIVQVDLGTRRHRHRTLRELSFQSTEILHAILVRSGFAQQSLAELTGDASSRCRLDERPALATVSAYVEARRAM